LGIGLQLVSNAVGIFLTTGVIRMLLSAGRDENPELSQLFSGGPWFWRVVGFTILIYVLLILGLVLLIIPMFIMLFMWWPAILLIVDNKAGVMESFGMARTITKGNWGTSFVLALASIGISILGVLALCVGMLAAIPFTYLMFVSAYLLMSGQVGRIDDLDQGPMDYGFDQA
jgi:uncharacterized membrane protein